MNTLKLTGEHKTFIESLLGLGNNMAQLREMFNTKFGEKLSIANFKAVLDTLGIDLKKDNKTKFQHDEADFIKEVKSMLATGLKKSQIYDEINKKFACTLTAFNEVTAAHIDWRKDNRTATFKIELDI